MKHQLRAEFGKGVTCTVCQKSWPKPPPPKDLCPLPPYITPSLASIPYGAMTMAQFEERKCAERGNRAREIGKLVDGTIIVMPYFPFVDSRCPTCRAIVRHRHDVAPHACHACQLREQRATDHAASTAWAQALLNNPDRFCILDTETTGLIKANQPMPQIVEIAVISGDGRPLLESLVRPDTAVPSAATAIHGIADLEVAKSPNWGIVGRLLRDAVAGRRVLVYNLGFDGPIIEALNVAYGLPRLSFSGECAMERYAAWVGDWNNRFKSYTWQPLPSSKHRAIGDCEAALMVLKRMAGK